MRLKTAYREKSAEKIPEPPAEIPEIKIEGEPATVATISAEIPPDGEPSDAIDAALDAAAEVDQSKLALVKQLESLRQSEALQRQHHQAAMMAQHAQPTTREGKLAMWKQQGMSETEERFLSEHPILIDHPEVTQAAVADAVQSGVERGTPEFFSAVREGFDQHLRHAQAQGAASAPEFFKPPPPLPPPSNAHIVSAPVTRGEIGGYREPAPSQVRLSAEEKEIARNSGISEIAYARNKLKMLKEKASGERQ